MRIANGILAGTIAAMTLQYSGSALAVPSHNPKDPPQPTTFLVPSDQVIAIRAGQLYDPVAGKMLSNQVVIIRGDRIAEVGAGLSIPGGARIIDMSNATVMPGMIDAHVHTYRDGLNPGEHALHGLASAQRDLDAGFTSLRDVDSGGGFGTVNLRDLIDTGLVLGPRMQVVGQALNNRNMTYVPDPETSAFYSGRTQNKDINGPWLARAAVREAKNHGVDSIKMYSTEDFDADTHLWNADGSIRVYPSISAEEALAIVDEAHRLGLKVACHSYLGTASDPCLIAAVDSPQHLEQLDEAGVKILLEKHLIFTPTIDDLLALEKTDLEESHGMNSRKKLLEAAFRRAHAAGIPIAFGSGATGTLIPHGKQGDQFAYMVKWGMTPVEALRTTYINAPKDMNYHFERKVGTIEKGKYADIIAVAGNPLQDVTEMERVKFVMKGGLVVRDNISAGAAKAYEMEHPK
jgi:imidazolonepropionase-like amidohydrolase